MLQRKRRKKEENSRSLLTHWTEPCVFRSRRQPRTHASFTYVLTATTSPILHFYREKHQSGTWLPCSGRRVQSAHTVHSTTLVLEENWPTRWNSINWLDYAHEKKAIGASLVELQSHVNLMQTCKKKNINIFFFLTATNFPSVTSLSSVVSLPSHDCFCTSLPFSRVTTVCKQTKKQIR